MLLDPSLKSLVDLNTMFVTIVVLWVILDHIALSFQLLKESKEKRNLSLLEVAMKAKPDLGVNGKLLKKVFDVLTSLSICIFGSHFSDPRLTSHKTLIPKNRSIWMRKDSYG